jgi:hypothetical protein
MGDRGGPPWFAHTASYEAVLGVETIAESRDGHPPDVS